jgi:hypothetical protein
MHAHSEPFATFPGVQAAVEGGGSVFDDDGAGEEDDDDDDGAGDGDGDDDELQPTTPITTTRQVLR